MNTRNVTIEQLAERFNQTVWVKGDLKRIYLNDEGYNTKKMSTKTFVWQDENGNFIVSCKVECPSQPWQWCKSQEQEVKDTVLSKIDNAIAQINAVLVDFKISEENQNQMTVYVKENIEKEPVWYTEELFFDKFGCYPNELFKQLPEPKSEIFLLKESGQLIKIEAEKTAAVFEAVGEKYSHFKFGVGVVLSEDDQTITLDFEGVGEKKLLKRFGLLTKVG